MDWEAQGLSYAAVVLVLGWGGVFFSYWVSPSKKANVSEARRWADAALAVEEPRV